jgi:hypothetical protein
VHNFGPPELVDEQGARWTRLVDLVRPDPTLDPVVSALLGWALGRTASVSVLGAVKE